ncbi:hypothetical protein F5Y17DRAFT_451678 [Xylariaceae sp. FL0594]|nr:hypothetical protein F5Y17DRAFT_451678 [Xylariaceae sp. FL0594]
MDNPEEQIVQVIHSLTQGSKEEQARALNDYFLPTAYFVHPFCRVPSFEPWTVKVPVVNLSWTVTSRWLVQLVYQWYKILSPVILLDVESVAFDRKTNLLYATIRQTFTIWFAPASLWQANVRFVCLLELAHLPVVDDDIVKQEHKPQRYRYFIKGQQDNYQVTEFLKFIDPLRILVASWYAWQILATCLCALGIPLLGPLKDLYVKVFLPKREEREDGRQHQKKGLKFESVENEQEEGEEKERGHWQEVPASSSSSSRKRS